MDIVRKPHNRRVVRDDARRLGVARGRIRQRAVAREDVVEVGEVRRGAIRLDEIVAPVGVQAGFECGAVLINTQRFTKTANIWGVENNRLGTNSNRIVLFRKPD